VYLPALPSTHIRGAPSPTASHSIVRHSDWETLHIEPIAEYCAFSAFRHAARDGAAYADGAAWLVRGGHYMARKRAQRRDIDPASSFGVGSEDRLSALMPRGAAEWLVGAMVLVEDLSLVFRQGQLLLDEARRRRWHAQLLDKNFAGQFWSSGLLASEAALEKSYAQGPGAIFVNAAAGYAQVASALLRALSRPTGTAAATIDPVKIGNLANAGSKVTSLKSEVLKQPRRHPSWNDDTNNAFMAEYRQLVTDVSGAVAFADERGLTTLADIANQGDFTGGNLADESFRRYGDVCSGAIFDLTS
jgi:hypothetical protein